MHLTIFLSYASEDQKFATVIADRLMSAFNRAVDLRYMSQFPLGINYRTLIDQSLDAADILLVIATGREKLSHSFTGYEVGYFRKSQQTRPRVEANKDVDRLIIPVAVVGDVPAPIADFEGIGVGERDCFLFAGGTAEASQQSNPFFQLLMRIDGILDKLSATQRSPEHTAKAVADYRAESTQFYQGLTAVMNTLPLRRDFPKTRLSLRLQADYNTQAGEPDDRVVLSCQGPTSGIFEREQPEDWFTWKELSTRIGSDDLALGWSDALRSLIASAVAGDFVNSDQLVFSFDQKRLFRLFVSKSTTYFDRTRELDVYVIEVLRPHDVGDPFTTYLAKALEIALRYRSLFLEHNSPHGPAIRLTKPDAWRTTIKDVLRELRLLLMLSRQAGLSDTRYIVELYGADEASIAGVQATMKTWLDQKAILYRTAEAVLGEPAVTEEGFIAFTSALAKFATHTQQLNEAFTIKVLERLGEEVRRKPAAA